MTTISPGIDHFSKTCAELGITADLGAAVPTPPKEVLGHPLDPALAKFYRAHDGGWWSSAQFSLRIYPLKGPDALEWRNTSIRRGADEAAPYPFDKLLIFAQYGRQAAYLAAVTGEKVGEEQPVIYLDTAEEPWALPIASSIDGAFALIGDHLHAAAAQGSINELAFPRDIPELVARDASLRTAARNGRFEGLTDSGEENAD